MTEDNIKRIFKRKFVKLVSPDKARENKYAEAVRGGSINVAPRGRLLPRLINGLQK